MTDPYASHRRGMAVAAAGVFVLSFDALLVRLAAADAWDVVFWRAWLICLSLAVVQLLRRRPWLPPGRGPRLVGLAAAVLLGIDMALFVLSVSHTRVANTVVILAASPLFAGIFTWLFLGERVRPRTWAAIAVATGGIAAVFGGSMGLGLWRGDLLALLLALFMGAVLTLLRAQPALERIPLVCLSGLVGGLLAWPLADPLSLGAPSYAVLALMGLVQMPLALVLIATATRYLPAPEVSLFMLIESVLGPLWVWAMLGEDPPRATFYGGAAVLGAVAVHSWLALGEARRRSRAARTAA